LIGEEQLVPKNNLPRLVEVVLLSNTHKCTQRRKENEETGKYIPKEIMRKIPKN
jgi:hypothetical protein